MTGFRMWSCWRGGTNLEETGWRWTARCFGARVRGGESARVVTMWLYIGGGVDSASGAMTLSVTANGRPLEPAVYETAGWLRLCGGLRGGDGGGDRAAV